MSFGWSAGDIVAAISLVSNVIRSVGSIGGSREHFQELESELDGLQRALREISDLASQPGQIPEIVALKFAACLCYETVQRFFGKIKPFEETLGRSSKSSKLKAAPRMVRWELLVKKDIPEFRSYLVAHVGSLNLRLNAALLKVASKSIVSSNANYVELQQSIATLRSNQQSQTETLYQKISLIPNAETVPKLESLLAAAGDVWKMQSEMMEMLAKAVERPPPPDLYHTWAQPPMKFEDALGRIIPVPSEYDWDKLEAIIEAQFKTGPGWAKVRSGEYELFYKLGGIAGPINNCKFFPIPGMAITMAFIIGQYAGSERCPRLGCDSRSFLPAKNSLGKICSRCNGWIRKSSSSLPKPLKPPDMDQVYSNPLKLGSRRFPVDATVKTYPEYEERRCYKNISIYVTNLPPTPNRFRDKYHRGYGNRDYEAYGFCSPIDQGVGRSVGSISGIRNLRSVVQPLPSERHIFDIRDGRSFVWPLPSRDTIISRLFKSPFST